MKWIFLTWAKYKKYLKPLLIILLWIYFYYIGKLTTGRLFIFFFIYCIIIFYIKIYSLIGSLLYTKKIENYVIKNKYVFKHINKILIQINNFKNPFLYLNVYLDKVLYIIYKNINYVLKNFLTHNSYIFICFILDLMLFGILKIILGFYYKLLLSFRMLKSLYEILLHRMYGLVFSILIFTNIIEVLKVLILKNGLKAFLILYLIIIIFYVLIYLLSTSLLKNEKYYQENPYKIISILFFLINNFMRSSKSFLSSHYLKSLRENVTLSARVIEFLNFCITHTDINSGSSCFQSSVQGIKLPFKKKESIIFIRGNFKGVMLQKDNQNVLITTIKLVYIKNKIDIKDYNNLGIGSPFLEVNFLYMWLYNKYIVYYQISYYRYYDNKNYPTYFLYNFLFELNINIKWKELNTPFLSLMNHLYYEFRIKELPKLVLNNEIKEALNFIIKVEKSRIKLLFDMIWDIEECLDIENYNYEYWVFHKDEVDGIYYLRLNPTLSKFEYKLKKANAFYDLDNNLEIFRNIFKYFIIVDNTIKNIVWKNLIGDATFIHISQELELYFNTILFLTKELGAELQFNRYNVFQEEGFNIKNYEVEEFLKNGALLYIKEIRKEWEKEKGNQKILNEFSHLENLFQDFKEYQSKLKI